MLCKIYHNLDDEYFLEQFPYFKRFSRGTFMVRILTKIIAMLPFGMVFSILDIIYPRGIVTALSLLRLSYPRPLFACFR